MKKILHIVGALQILLIFTLSLIPSSGQEDLFPHADKVSHAFGYMVVTFTYCELFERKHHFKFFILFSLMGILIEFLQRLTGYRNFDYFDMAANTLGALAAFIGAGRIKIFRLYA